MSAQRMKVWLPMLLVVAGAAVMALLGRLQPEVAEVEAEPVVPAVEWTEAEVAADGVVLEAHGVATAPRRSRLTSRVSGTVEWVSPAFEAGSPVAAGEELVRLDPLPYESALAEARSRVAAARLALANEQAASQQALVDWRRLHGAAEPDPLVARSPQLELASAELAAAQAALAYAESQLSHTRIRSPFAGRVVVRSIDLGHALAASATVLGEVVSAERIEVALPLPLAEVALLPHGANGQPALPVAVELSAQVGLTLHRWHGQVVRMDTMASERTRTLRAFVEIEPPFISDHGMQLQLGTVLQARLRGAALTDGFVVPRTALQADGSLHVITQGDRLERREIDVLLAMRDRVVVRGQLAEGERISITPLLFFVDGMVVEPQDAGAVEP